MKKENIELEAGKTLAWTLAVAILLFAIGYALGMGVCQ